jgi:hypothetical protein
VNPTESGPEPAAPAICSAKGCRDSASWSVVWNNPKLHTPDRRKAWLACDEHRGHLADFLDLRGFLLGVEPFVADGGTPGDSPEISPR